MTETRKPTRGEAITLAANGIVVVIQGVLRGFSILLTWNWFVATTLRVPLINLVEAIGFSFFLSAMLPNSIRLGTYKNKTDMEMLREDVRKTMTGPVLVIVVAFAWHLVTTL